MPPDPMMRPPSQSRVGKRSRTAHRTARRSSRIAFCFVPPERKRSVVRMAPNGNDSSRSTRPSAASTSSSEPPPMSITTVRPTPRSKCASALRKERRASSSPLSKRTRMPVSARTRSRNAPPFSASRTALVATASMRDAPSCEARATMRESDVSAASIDASASNAVRLTPAPRRGIARISSMTRIFPSGETSATICRMEFEPMSIAAMRTSRTSSDAHASVPLGTWPPSVITTPTAKLVRARRRAARRVGVI